LDSEAWFAQIFWGSMPLKSDVLLIMTLSSSTWFAVVNV
jgi:hypothetical protein